MRRVAALLVLILLQPAWAVEATVSDADGVVAALRERVRMPSVLRGSFEQTRVLNLLRRPLRSSGRFLVAQGYGLIWEQTAPFESRLLLTDERMVQRVAQGDPVVMRADEAPVPFAISQVFLDLLSGDGAGLEQHFELSFTASDDAWQLSLIPLPGPLASAIARVEVSGRDYVEGIEVHTVRGDSTTIRMSDISDLPLELSTTELEAFDD